MQSRAESAAPSEKRKNPDQFKRWIDSAIGELQEFATNEEIRARGYLLESEKDKIRDLVNGIDIVLSSFEESWKEETDFPEGMRDYLTQVREDIFVATQGFGSMNVQNEDGDPVENDIPEVGPNVVEGIVKELPDQTEREKFDEWKNEFVKRRNILAGKMTKADGSTDPIELGREFDDLEDFFETASNNPEWDDFSDERDAKERQLERLARRLKKLMPAAKESGGNAKVEDYSKLDPNHRKELVALHNLVSDNESFLTDSPKWDPRAVGGNLINAITVKLATARKLRDAIASVRGVVGFDMGENIDATYIHPAEKFLQKLKIRAEKIDEGIIDKWKEELRNDTKYPKVDLLYKEFNKVLPRAPYISPDTPEEMIVALKTLIEEAQEELDDKGYFSEDLGEAQKKYLRLDYFSQADNKVKVLEELRDEVELGEKLKEWTTSIKEFEETIDLILELPEDAGENATDEGIIIFALERRLSAIYDELMDDGLLDPDVEDATARTRVTGLVGKDQKSGRYARALKKITEIAGEVRTEAGHARNLSWPDLIKAIEDTGIDIYDHGPYMAPNAQGRKVEIYQAFHKRKTALDRDKYEDTPEGYEQYMKDEQERIDSVTWVVLSKIETINQNEGQVPTCTRPDLFPMLIKRHMERDTILKAITYHPVHGELLRRMFDKTIVAVTEKSSGIFYDHITSSGDGRNEIAKFMRTNFEAEAVALYEGLPEYANLPEEERKEKVKEKVDRLFGLATVTYNLFDLLTVSFAELQKNTKTEAHQKTKGGVFLEKKNLVAVCRPDTAWVHSTERYASPSHVSALFALYLKMVPDEYGRDDGDGKMTDEQVERFHEMLLEQQEEIIAFQSCYYDVSAISGKNGIEATSLFEPLYPDTRTFLHAAPNFRGATEMLAFGDDIYGMTGEQTIGTDGIPRENYIKLGKKGDMYTFADGTRKKLNSSFAITAWYEEVGMGGWEKILSLTFGTLPAKITEHNILKQSDMGGDNVTLGYIDTMINSGCGMAKMFPGRHMEAVTQLFSHYIMRVFSRYRAGDSWRHNTYREVVLKLQTAAATGGGLSGHRNVAAQIIRNISENIPDTWSDNEVLDVDVEELDMGEVLVKSVDARRKQRIQWILSHYQKENRGIPPSVDISLVSSTLVNIRRFFDQYEFIDEGYFWKMVDGDLPIPTDGVNRNTSLFKSVDEQHR